MTEKMSDNLLKKALDTNLGIMPPVDKKNGLDIPEFREPNFNELTIQKRIEKLEDEISIIRLSAFCNLMLNGVGFCGGVEVEELQAKIVLRDSLKENLKTEKLR